jgi:hypothetical protein
MNCTVSSPHQHPHLRPSRCPDCRGSRVKSEMRERTGSRLYRVRTIRPTDHEGARPPVEYELEL